MVDAKWYGIEPVSTVKGCIAVTSVYFSEPPFREELARSYQ